MRLKEKIVLITGAARGIGQVIAELFHKNGATVIISDINDSLGKSVAEKSRFFLQALNIKLTDEEKQ